MILKPSVSSNDSLKNNYVGFVFKLVLELLTNGRNKFCIISVKSNNGQNYLQMSPFLVEFNPNVKFYFSLNLIKTNEHLKNVFVQLALMNLRR